MIVSISPVAVTMMIAGDALMSKDQHPRRVQRKSDVAGSRLKARNQDMLAAMNC